MFGFFFLLTQYFQLVLGYSAFEAGLKQLPFAAVMMVIAPNSPKLAARLGTNRAVAFGLCLTAAAMYSFLLTGKGTSYVELLPIMGLMAAGMATCIPSMTGSIMSAVPLGKAGVGSAMNDTTRELGGALGVAVLGSLVASQYAKKLPRALDLLPDSLHGQAGESLAGALHAASTVGGDTGAQVGRIARDAFVSGMHLAAIIGGSVAVLAAIIVYRKLPAGNPHAQGAASVGRGEPDLYVDYST